MSFKSYHMPIKSIECRKLEMSKKVEKRRGEKITHQSLARRP